MNPRILTLCVLLLSFCHASAQYNANDITGTWLTGGNEPAKIFIYKSGEKFCGKITWLKKDTENGNQKHDKNNPDKEKRNEPIIGLIILKNFTFTGNNEWQGNIYDPESGKTYNCIISLKDKLTLRVRGYIGLSLFGRTEIWRKHE